MIFPWHQNDIQIYPGFPVKSPYWKSFQVPTATESGPSCTPSLTEWWDRLQTTSCSCTRDGWGEASILGLYQIPANLLELTELSGISIYCEILAHFMLDWGFYPLFFGADTASKQNTKAEPRNFDGNPKWPRTTCKKASIGDLRRRENRSAWPHLPCSDSLEILCSLHTSMCFSNLGPVQILVCSRLNSVQLARHRVYDVQGPSFVIITKGTATYAQTYSEDTG